MEDFEENIAQSTPTAYVKKPRRKLLPAPIKQLNEFNVSEYLQNLPCGLSVGQAAHEIPKYRSGLIRAIRRTREKETNYVEQQTSSTDTDQTTAANVKSMLEKNQSRL